MIGPRLTVRSLPPALIALRSVLGPLLFLDAHDGTTGPWFVAGLWVAFASDVLDGVIARRIGAATPGLRAADSAADGWFCAWVAACVWAAHREMVLAYAPGLALFVATDFLGLALDLVKYRRFAAYHAYSAKLAGLLLFLAILWLFAFDWGSGVLFWSAIAVGIVSHLERLAITCLLPRWTPDVPSVWHARRLRQVSSVLRPATRRPSGARQ